MFVADHVTIRRYRGGTITVEEYIFASGVFGSQDLFRTEFFEQLLQLPIVIAGEHDQFAFAFGVRH